MGGSDSTDWGAPSSNAVCVGNGIDALHVWFVACVHEDVLRDLNAWERAGRKRTVKSIAGIDWTVEPARFVNGRQTYSFQLVNGKLATIGITDGRNLRFPTIYVRLDCKALWTYGGLRGALAAFAVWNVVRAWIARIATVTREVVGKIELSADLIGWHPTEADRRLFAGYGARREPRRRRGSAVGALHDGVDDDSPTFEFKRGSALSASVYDKTQEIERTGKSWFRERVWGPIAPGEHVHRVEFRWTAPELRKRLGGADPSLVLSALGVLWRRAVGQPGSRGGWLRLTNLADAATRKDRRGVSPTWEVVRRVSWPNPDGGTVAALDQDQPRSANPEAFLPSVRGLLTSLAAAGGTTEAAVALGMVLTPQFLADFPAAARAKAIKQGITIKPPTSAAASAEARAAPWLSAEKSGPVADLVWDEVLRELRVTAALLVARREPTPWTAAARALVDDAERCAPLRVGRDKDGTPYAYREPSSAEAWDKLRVLYALMTAVNLADQHSADHWAILAT